MNLKTGAQQSATSYCPEEAHDTLGEKTSTGCVNETLLRGPSFIYVTITKCPDKKQRRGEKSLFGLYFQVTVPGEVKAGTLVQTPTRTPRLWLPCYITKPWKGVIEYYFESLLFCFNLTFSSLKLFSNHFPRNGVA